MLQELSPAFVVSFLTIAGGAAFGVLTGLGAQAGVLSMIAASLFGWLFGGIPVKASGPTGPTASVMLSTVIAVQALNIDLSAVYIILIAAGILLFILGFLPLHKLIGLIPNVATAVFINGVAIIIIENQVRKIIGFQSLEGPERWWDTGIAIGSLVFLFIWPKISGGIQMTKIGKLLSGSLMVMLLGFIINVSFGNPSEGIMVEGDLFNGFAIDPSIFSQIPLDLLFISAIKIAFIIFFVTVVSARALKVKNAKDYKAELKNIGIANIAVAALGGMASSIGFVRSKLLQNNGGQTAFSGIFTAVLVLVLLIVAKPVLMQIPVAVFIGILIKAVWGSMDWQFLKDFRVSPKKNAINFFTVLIGSIAMIWFDQALVVIVASIIWVLLNKIPSTAPICEDMSECPIASQNLDN